MSDAVQSSLSLGLMFGLIFLTIIAITIAVSIAVYLKVRKMTFHMQRNRAYHGATVTSNQDVVMTSLDQTAMYIYPTADNDEGERSTTAIITEQNEAYETEKYDNPLQNLEITYAEVDIIVGGAGASNLSSLGRQSKATPTAGEDWRQASLESNKAYGMIESDNAYYESMTDSGTAEKYDYIQN